MRDEKLARVREFFQVDSIIVNDFHIKRVQERRLNDLARFNIYRDGNSAAREGASNSHAVQRPLYMPFIVMQCAPDTDVEIHLPEDR